MSKWMVYYLMFLEELGVIDGEEEMALLFISLDPRRKENQN